MSLPDALRSLAEDSDAILGFVGAAAIVFALTPVAGWLAPRIGGVDDAGDRPRVHTEPVPRIGGLAILAGILVPAFALLDLSDPYRGILIGTLAVGALGLLDDIRGISPPLKLAGIALVTLIPVVGYDVTFDRVTLPVIGEHDVGWIRYPLAVLWILLLTNLINLIDGMDSLAAGIVSIAALSFAILAASFLRPDAAALALIVCGATLAFLWHNYHPARIFMGDSGALALGFLLGSLAVEGVLKTAAAIALVAPLLVVAVPILDTSFVVLKRLKYKRAPWGADHNHFYHRFMRIGFSQRRTAAYLHLWASLLAGYALLARFVPPRPEGHWDLGNSLILIAAGLVVIAVSGLMVYALEILKARHLHYLGLGRLLERRMGREGRRITEEFEAVGPPTEHDTLEHALSSRVPEPTEEPAEAAPADPAESAIGAARDPSSRS